MVSSIEIPSTHCDSQNLDLNDKEIEDKVTGLVKTGI